MIKSNQKRKWEKSSFKGVRFYKHDTKKHGVKYDRYFSGSYQINKKRKFIGFGWASEGWSEKIVWEKLNQYKYNVKTGSGPTTLKEEFLLKEQARQQKVEREEKDQFKNITLKMFYDTYYLPAAVKSKRNDTTMPTEKSYFKVWINPEIGHLKFRDIQPIHFENIKNKLLNKGKAPRTLEHCFAIFNKIWSYAKIHDLVNTDSPAKKIDRPKVENERTRFFTKKEAELLLKSLKKRSQQVHDMTLLSLHTGARGRELFNLIWRMVSFENRSLQLRDSKGKPRHVYLTDETHNMLTRLYKDQYSSDLVFKNNKGGKINAVGQTFSKIVKELKLNKGVTDRRDKASFHTCRHTFASWHAQNGTDLYVLKKLLGHSTIQLTERYSHLRVDSLKVASQNFNLNLQNE
ncbi:MAG: site-specific integrase [Desulfobacula sp.]|uniref:tyrosine-type recombinase/integrase n=1 Tax=Desulfobacula sp. TaxID=2593537 RepID=UPI002A031B92|nr:site-specific integrase [Desulfobacula sp.]